MTRRFGRNQRRRAREEIARLEAELTAASRWARREYEAAYTKASLDFAFATNLHREVYHRLADELARQIVHQTPEVIKEAVDFVLLSRAPMVSARPADDSFKYRLVLPAAEVSLFMPAIRGRGLQ